MQHAWLRCRDTQPETLTVTVELGGVHALYRGHAALVLTAMLNARGVFKYVGALGQSYRISYS
jgi:hypothetical protein